MNSGFVSSSKKHCYHGSYSSRIMGIPPLYAVNNHCMQSSCRPWQTLFHLGIHVQERFSRTYTRLNNASTQGSSPTLTPPPDLSVSLHTYKGCHLLFWIKHFPPECLVSFVNRWPLVWDTPNTWLTPVQTEHWGWKESIQTSSASRTSLTVLAIQQYLSGNQHAAHQRTKKHSRARD